MRAIIVILICVIPLVTRAQNRVTIQGRLNKLSDSTKVYLQYPDTSGLIFKAIDSTLIINGQFSFLLKNNVPEVVFLTIRRKSITSPPADDSDQLAVYLMSSSSPLLVVSNTHNIKDATVIGSKNNTDVVNYNNLVKPLQKDSQALLAKFKARGPDAIKDTLFMKELISERDIQNKRYLDLALLFIRRNYNSYCALGILQSCFLQGVIDHNIAESEFSKFSYELKKTNLGKQISKAIINSKIEPRGEGPR
ncbi:DUF4369 domain-containing protein [Pedobacter sp. NJ-S-72]